MKTRGNFQGIPEITRAARGSKIWNIRVMLFMDGPMANSDIFAESMENENETNSTEELLPPSSYYLAYDCELGIYHLPNLVTRTTSGSTYGLDICLDKACQSFLLSMPQNSHEESHRILIETQPLTQEGHLIMHFPGKIKFEKSVAALENSF